MKSDEGLQIGTCKYEFLLCTNRSRYKLGAHNLTAKIT